MIPYSRQSISKKDILEVNKVLRSDFLTQGRKVGEFEKLVSKISLRGYVKNYYLSNSICRASKTMGSLARARNSINLKKAS